MSVLTSAEAGGEGQARVWVEQRLFGHLLVRRRDVWTGFERPVSLRWLDDDVQIGGVDLRIE